MTFQTILLVGFIVVGAGVILNCSLTLLKDKLKISRTEAQLRQLQCRPQILSISRSEPKFAAPPILNHENWANFERLGIPNLILIQVVVVADTVEQPINGLQKAVLENFKRGVKYCFIVSGSKAEEEVKGFYGIYAQLAAIAINKFGADFKLDDLVTILKLPDEWNNVPFVFYRMKEGHAANAEIRTIAFRGDTEKAGIADQYSAVDQNTAEGLWKLLMGRPPEKIEAAIAVGPNDGFLNPIIVLNSLSSMQSSAVV